MGAEGGWNEVEGGGVMICIEMKPRSELRCMAVACGAMEPRSGMRRTEMKSRGEA